MFRIGTVAPSDGRTGVHGRLREIEREREKEKEGNIKEESFKTE
jgi:hypothetical protein